MVMNDTGQTVSDPKVATLRLPVGTTPYKIALYGFGSQPPVQRHLIALAANEKLPLTWCSILPTPYFRSVMSEVLPQNEILDVFRSLPRVPVGGDVDCLVGYPGSLVEDLAAQKRRRRKRTGQWLLNRGIDYFKLYKAFLAERRATHILSPLVETPEAKIAVAAAQELGLGVIVPVDLRNITGICYSADCYQTPPRHAVADPNSRARAEEFIARFRANPTPASAPPRELFGNAEDYKFADYIPPLLSRVKQFAQSAIERPDIFDHDEVRRVVMANAGLLRNIIRGRRKRLNLAQYDIGGINELPKRFIYYPLQYTPEASINTPAPYFVEQTRMIDALRFAMPTNYTLVVKEHPACLAMRPVNFMRYLRGLPGVSVIKASAPSIEIIKRADLTATVTGTAAFEAFLLGRSALAFGPGLSAWTIGRMATIANLRAEIQGAIAAPPSESFIVEQTAKLMSVRYPCRFDTPRLPGEPMLRRKNMQAILSGLLDHLRREHDAQLRGSPGRA